MAQKTPPAKAKAKPRTTAAKSSTPVKAAPAKAATTDVAKNTAAQAASVKKAAPGKGAAAKETGVKESAVKATAARAAEETRSGEPLSRPASVTAAVVLTAAVAAAMTGYSVFLIIGGLVGQPVLRGRAETVGVIFLLFGLGIGWVCRGLAKLQPWSRTPAMLTHLLLVGSAYRIMQDSQYLEAVLVGLYGIAGLVALFVPASHKVLSRDVR